MNIVMMQLIILVPHFDNFVTRIEATSDSVISRHSHSCAVWQCHFTTQSFLCGLNYYAV